MQPVLQTQLYPNRHGHRIPFTLAVLIAFVTIMPFVTIMLLVTVISTNWGLGLSGLLLVGSIAVVRIPVEERELSERFGATWDAYARRTGRVMPRLQRSASP